MALAFLETNGVALTLGDDWIEVFEGVATGAVSRADLAQRLAAAMPNGDPVAVES